MTNIHINTNIIPPEGKTEVEKTLAAVQWWHQLAPNVRKNIIEGIENEEDYWCSVIDGWLVALLKILDLVDPKKLEEELK